MIRLRGGRGIGDGLYVHAIARALKGPLILTDLPDLYPGYQTAPFTRQDAEVVAHYANQRHSPYTQWEDVQRKADIFTELKIDWEVTNDFSWLDKYKPLLFVNGGRYPMNRPDGYALSILPEEKGFNAKLRELKKDYTAIYIGKGPQLYDVDFDIDLSNKTSITDLIDLGKKCDMFFQQCSFSTILAEVFDKPSLTMFASKPAKDEILRTITPKKILCKPTDSWCFDNLSDIRRCG